MEPASQSAEHEDKAKKGKGAEEGPVNVGSSALAAQSSSKATREGEVEEFEWSELILEALEAENAALISH
jgi:hypothetical protein